MSDDYIKWDPKFEQGIPIIDKQHKELIKLCDALYETITGVMRKESDDWREPFKKSLQFCANYVVVHFKSEETLMQAAGYEGFAAHKREHETFTAKILKTAQNFDTLSISDALHFTRFLYDWITSHIAYTDKLYVNSVLEYYRKTKKA